MTTRVALAWFAASLGLTLASACDDGKSRDGGDQSKPAPSETPTPAEPVPEPESLGLEDGQVWRLELDGEASVFGRYAGEVVHARRKQFDLSLTLEGEGTTMSLTLEQVPMGQTGRFTATPASFRASAQGIDCGTASGGKVKINLTHNEVDRLAGRIEGDTDCRLPSGVKARWSGAFDYAGAIEIK